MVRFITESTPYTDDDLKLYAAQAIKQGEITFKTLNDKIEESPILSKSCLKGCRENSNTNAQKAKVKKIDETQEGK